MQQNSFSNTMMNLIYPIFTAHKALQNVDFLHCKAFFEKI
jgi:hypothetical protein